MILVSKLLFYRAFFDKTNLSLGLLSILTFLHISLYQRNFTLKWTIIIFIPILQLLFQGMMPHDSHIPRDDLRPPNLHRNSIVTFILFFHIFMHMYISCSCCFSALQKLVEFWKVVIFVTFIGDPVYYIYHNITLFMHSAFMRIADTHASILLSCYPCYIMMSSLQQFFTGYNVTNYMTLSNQM